MRNLLRRSYLSVAMLIVLASIATAEILKRTLDTFRPEAAILKLKQTFTRPNCKMASAVFTDRVERFTRFLRIERSFSAN